MIFFFSARSCKAYCKDKNNNIALLRTVQLQSQSVKNTASNSQLGELDGLSYFLEGSQGVAASSETNPENT